MSSERARLGGATDEIWHPPAPTGRRAQHGTREGLLRLQRTAGNAATRLAVQRLGKLDMSKYAGLSEHIGARSRQQALMAEHGKHGQGMVESRVQDRADLRPASEGEVGEGEREAVSAKTRLLVDLVKFDDASDLSVLADAGNGGLSGQQMWRVIVANSELMSEIKEGLVINKIIPDSSIEQVLRDGSTWRPDSRESIGGSVAHQANYKDLTGSEAVANFGLDYGGYTDTRNGKKVLVEGSKEVSQYGSWGGLSPYVKETAPDSAGRTLANVQNVFYINMKVPAQSLGKVKVPLHANILKWAQRHREELILQRRNLSIPWVLERTQRDLPGTRAEIEAHVDKKLLILDRFLSAAFAPANMAVTTNLSGKKNPQDPLTNLGITKPSSRLQNRFGTINQEYHFGSAREDVPVGSGIWLKTTPATPGAAGVDVQVAELQDVPGRDLPGWVPIPAKRALIDKALAENRAFRTG